MANREPLVVTRRLCSAYVPRLPGSDQLTRTHSNANLLFLDRRRGLKERQRLLEQVGDARGARTLDFRNGGIGE